MTRIISGEKESPQSYCRLREKNAPLNPLKKRQKPQISSIPGISPKDPNRYRVMVGDEVIGTGLTSDEALKLARGGEA